MTTRMNVYNFIDQCHEIDQGQGLVQKYIKYLPAEEDSSSMAGTGRLSFCFSPLDVSTVLLLVSMSAPGVSSFGSSHADWATSLAVSWSELVIAISPWPKYNSPVSI